MNKCSFFIIIFVSSLNTYDMRKIVHFQKKEDVHTEYLTRMETYSPKDIEEFEKRYGHLRTVSKGSQRDVTIRVRNEKRP